MNIFVVRSLRPILAPLKIVTGMLISS